MGTMAASLPTLRPLLMRVLPFARDGSGVDSKGYANQGSTPRSGRWRKTDTSNSVTLKDVSDKDGSSSTHELTPAGGRDVELGEYDNQHRRSEPRIPGAYQVTVHADSPAAEASQPSDARAARGIKATTVVMQTSST
jgi:hypothetical protein